MVSSGGGLTFKESRIGGWLVPTIGFSEPARPPLRVAVRGLIINSIVDGARNRGRQQDWKVQVASAVKSARGAQAWSAHDEYAISLAMRFHLGSHGNRDLDAENFVKPVIDAIAAGLFCSNSTDPDSIAKWGYDDSNFKTLLIHRLPDAAARDGEGIAVCVSVRSGTAADVS